MAKRTGEQSINWKLSIPVRLATMVEQMLWNNSLRKPAYGERSNYIANLIERDLASKGIYTLADVVDLQETGKDEKENVML